MFKLTHFGVDNFRCFRSTGMVPLKPITVFVGKNSSGKSSYVRLFPLLRQSIEEKTKGPILWNGNFVDFGSFDESKHNNTEENIIYFRFNMILPTSFAQRKRRQDINIEESDAHVVLGVACDGKVTVAKKLSVAIESSKFEIEFNGDKVSKCTINDIPYGNLDDLFVFDKNRFIPEIAIKRKVQFTVSGETKTYIQIDDFNFFNKVEKIAISELKKYFWHRTSGETVLKAVIEPRNISRKSISALLESIYKTNRQFVDNYKASRDEILNKYSHYSFIYNMTSLIEEVDNSLKSYFRTIRYIGPLRAIAERYYRYKDLQADEVDHTGSNLPMVLNSLTPAQKDRFENWTKENFDFIVKLKEEGWHYAIKIQVGDDVKEYNINDMGFGFSQLLPIITSLWLEHTMPSGRRKGVVFVIEQPELHLHPAFQSKLSLMFCKIVEYAKSTNSNMKIIFETHSKTMVDTIGECIEDNIISSEDVTIAIVDKDNHKESMISFAKFDSNGNLSGWPIGFFSGR